MKAAVVIPTYNEEEGIRETINSIPEELDIIVVDGHSRDETVKIAKELGAQIIFSKGGKGQAVRKAFRTLDYPVYVVIDGDSTYNGSDILKLLRKIEGGNELVIGSRFPRGIKKMSWFRGLSNKILNFTFNFFNKRKLTDISSGLRAMTKDFVDSVELHSKDFRIETEITYKALSNNFRISEIPIRYKKRRGRSKLRLLDMIKIYLFAIKILVLSKFPPLMD